MADVLRAAPQLSQHELLGLRVEDVDLDGSTVRIARDDHLKREQNISRKLAERIAKAIDSRKRGPVFPRATLFQYFWKAAVRSAGLPRETVVRPKVRHAPRRVIYKQFADDEPLTFTEALHRLPVRSLGTLSTWTHSDYKHPALDDQPLTIIGYWTAPGGKKQPLVSVREIDRIRHWKPPTINPVPHAKRLTGSEAEADPDLGIPAKLICRWKRNGCPAHTPIPEPPARWTNSSIAGNTNMRLQPAGQRPVGPKRRPRDEFDRDELLKVKAAYQNPTPETPGYWPTWQEAKKLYGLQHTIKTFRDWENGCPWLDGEKLRWRNGRRANGWSLFGVVEYDPTQLALIAAAQRKAMLDEQEKEFKTCAKLADVHKRSERRIIAWTSCEWAVLGGRKPQTQPEIARLTKTGLKMPLKAHAGDIRAIAEFLDNRPLLGTDGEELSAWQGHKRFDLKLYQVCNALRLHAPGAARKVKRETGSGERTATVYPLAAMTAALRKAGHDIPDVAPAPNGDAPTMPGVAASRGKRPGDGRQQLVDDCGTDADLDEQLRLTANNGVEIVAANVTFREAGTVNFERASTVKLPQPATSSAKNARANPESEKNPVFAWEPDGPQIAADFKKRFRAEKAKGSKLTLKAYAEEFATEWHLASRSLENKLSTHRQKWDPDGEFGARPRKPK